MASMLRDPSSPKLEKIWWIPKAATEEQESDPSRS